MEEQPGWQCKLVLFDLRSHIVETYPTGQPNHDLLVSGLTLGWEEPEVQLPGCVIVLVDVEQSRIGLADVKVNFGNLCSIDDKL